MKAYAQIQAAFHKLDQSTVAWHKSARFPKTMETANAILYRNSIVDACTLAYLSHCLGITNKDIVSILDQYAKEVPKKAGEVAVLKKLIAPVDLTETEQILITRLRKLDTVKQKIITDMVGAL